MPVGRGLSLIEHTFVEARSTSSIKAIVSPLTTLVEASVKNKLTMSVDLSAFGLIVINPKWFRLNYQRMSMRTDFNEVVCVTQIICNALDLSAATALVLYVRKL